MSRSQISLLTRLSPFIAASGATLFMVQHFLWSGPYRNKLIAQAGGSEERFRQHYSLASFATLGPAAVALFQMHRGRWQAAKVSHGLWNTQSVLAKSARILSVGSGVALFSQFKAAPSAMGEAQQEGEQDVVQAEVTPTGALRITRSPMMNAMGLVSFGNFLTTPTMSGLIFWGCMATTAWGGMVTQDNRLTQNGVLKEEFLQETSLVPFKAVFDGRQQLNPDEFSAVQLVAGLALFGWIQTGATGLAAASRAIRGSPKPGPGPAT